MSSDTVAEGGLPTVQILVPATWHELDLDPGTRAVSIARLADRATKSGSDFDEARARMRAEFEKVAQMGSAAGAVLAFVHWPATEGKIASASLYIAMVDPRPGNPVQAPPDHRNIAAAIAARYGGDVSDLPVGPAARVRRRLRLPDEPLTALALDPHSAEAETVTWYIPHEWAKRIAVLTFSTPNVELGDEFGEVFDAVASTVRWTA